MVIFKGILKYGLYLFIAGWMFVLGIMVGRGNAPIEFDTGKFQERLEHIAQEFGKGKTQDKKVELTFYDVLDQPPQQTQAVHNREPEKKNTLEKVSLKKQTYKKSLRSTVENKAPAPIQKAVDLPGKKVSPEKKIQREKEQKNSSSKGYTLQIAAYRLEKDAIARMEKLHQKGIAAYKISAQSKGVVWHRVRSGSFATYDAAKAYKQKLEKLKIHAIVYKKDL